MNKFIPDSPDMRQYITVVLVNLCILSLGMNIVWASPMMIKFRDLDNPILSRPLTESEEAWVVSISMVVGLVVLFLTGSIMNVLGQKKSLIAAHIPRFASCFFLLFGKEPWMILLARALVGVSDSVTLAMVPTYVAEVAGKNIRGASGTVTQIASSVGMLIVLGVGPFVSYYAINTLMTFIFVVNFVPLWFIPESPYHLYQKGQSHKAIEVLTFLYGSEIEAQEQFREYSDNSDDRNPANKWELLQDFTVIKTFAIVILMSFGQQLIGINAINFYLQTIFESTQSTISPELSSLIIGFIQLIACSCTFFLTDRFGRKPILCISLLAMCIGLSALGIFFFLLQEGYQIRGLLNFLPLMSIILVIYGFNAGVGSLFWILIAELFDGPLRSYGIFAALFISTLSNFLLSRFFVALTNALGAAGTYWFFGGNCVLLCLFIFFFIPETKGKTFSEIQSALGRLKKIIGKEIV